MKTYVQIGTAYGKDFFYNYIKDLNPSETNIVLVEPLQHEASIEFYKNTDEIEFLCIDAEGLDVELLNSIDYEKYNIRNIFFEYWDFDDDANNVYKSKSKYAELDEKLKNNGFTIKETIDTDGNTNFLYRKP